MGLIFETEDENSLRSRVNIISGEDTIGTLDFNFEKQRWFFTPTNTEFYYQELYEIMRYLRELDNKFIRGVK